MNRRRTTGSVTAVLLAGLLAAGPAAAPASAWTVTDNPVPSQTVGRADGNAEGSTLALVGGPLKVSLHIPPRPPAGKPIPEGVVGQHVTVQTIQETRDRRKVISTVTTSTKEVRLTSDKASATVAPGAFTIPNVDNTHRLKYVVTWRWITSATGKPLPDVVRQKTVEPTVRADAVCSVSGFGACTVEEFGWLRLGFKPR